jgi:glycosyltransferase involved in cell wall biosynthesis
LPSALIERVIHVPHDVACDPVLPERGIRAGPRIRLLSVCRLVPKKGIDVVLKALALLGSGACYQYRVIGDGSELPRLRALARSLGLHDVQFLGARPPDDVAVELAWADLFVLGTRTAVDGDRDGIPNAILEAMAAGVPVVAGNAGGVGEIIRDRETGWLTPANDETALADAIRVAVSDPSSRQRIASNAHAEVWQRFSRNRTTSLLTLRLTSELAVQARVDRW